MGLIIQSIIVYGLIIAIMNYFGKIAYKKQYPQCFGGIDRFKNNKIGILTLFTKFYFVIPIFVFCLFAAIRYKVGVDCETYKQLFYEIQTFGSTQRREIEFGYNFLCNISNYLTGAHYLLFFLMALLQIGLYYYALRKHTYILIFLSMALLFTNMYWSWMNGMRQNIAACAFVSIIPFIINKKKWIYILLAVFIAMQMHKSALIIIPISITAYFLRNSIPNKYLQLGILALCFLLMNKFNNLLESFSYLAMNAGYSMESIESYTELEETTRTFGFRMILLYAVYIITIWFSNKMSKFCQSKEFNIWYNLHFIGICLSVLFYNNFTITRILYYFVIFTPIVTSMLLFYLHHYKKKQLFTIAIILLVAGFLYTLYNSTGNMQTEAFLYKFDL